MPDVNPGLIPAPAPSQTYEYLFGTSSPDAPYSRNGRRYWGWDPCLPITYAVNAQRATQAQMDALNQAIRQVEEASGFDLVYAGEATGSMYIGNNGSAVAAPVIGGSPVMAVFGFSDPYETPVLDGPTIGIGGIGGGDNIRATTSGRRWIVKGGYAIADVTDVTSPSRLTSTFSHEIGHMLGLDHVTSPNELMYGFISPLTDFQTGDRNGLYSIGEPQCVGGAPLRERNAAPVDLETIDVEQWVAD
jgi:hypothetical protein